MDKAHKKDRKIQRRKHIVIGILGAAMLAVLLLFFICFLCGDRMNLPAKLLPGNRKAIVGEEIALEEITEFYYTYATSTYPPDYQRYHFYIADGKYQFYHEKREGKNWPLTEANITLSGTKDLSEEEWTNFLACISGGSVSKRSSPTEAGGSGPWLYLYWNGDRSIYQSFSFASHSDAAAFEELCTLLKDSQ